jgi:hypothetical protein
MSTVSVNPKITITLSDRRPITILKDRWPVIASSKAEYNFNHDVSPELYRISKWWIKIRHHYIDERAIVYAGYRHDTNFPGEPDYLIRGGVLVDDDDLNEAIQNVGKWMSTQYHAKKGERLWQQLTRDCFADLPAEEVV